MDVTSLASQLTQMLTPFLPTLLGVGKEFAGGIWKKAGGDTFDFVKNQIWNRLKPKVEEHRHGSLAVSQLAESPQSTDFQASFRKVLTAILTDNPQLATELAAVVTPETVQRVTADGHSLIADIEQDTSGEGKTKQEIDARDASTIIGVRQKKT